MIVAINERPVNTLNDLHRFLTEGQIGRPVTLTIVRGLEKLRIMIVPMESRQ